MEKKDIQTAVKKHELFTSMLCELLKSLLKASDVKYHVIEQRTKTFESLEEKIIRKDIHNIEKEITDISGIRIILYYQDDVDKMTNLIKENFTIDEKNSINKGDLYGSNEFGYLSIHYIVSLDGKRNNLPEWKSFSSLKAEIQIRTVLQHSWASISHELSYKKDYEIPKELQRRLFRLAGLFELADEQFLKIRDAHIELKQSIEESKPNEIKSESINLLTLQYSFKQKNVIYNKIENLAIEAGFMGTPDRVSDRYLSEIIRGADLLGIKRIHELEDALTRNFNSFRDFFTDLMKLNDTPWHGDKSFYSLLALLSLQSTAQLNDFFKNSGWSPNIVDIVKKVVAHKRDL